MFYNGYLTIEAAPKRKNKYKYKILTGLLFAGIILSFLYGNL